ncbi:MAG: phosphatidylinositol transfer protein [Deltaproteobacteria bacterium]|nr:phosphatidylinositol transfer protein [Deltaproteobacteria bacterium]
MKFARIGSFTFVSFVLGCSGATAETNENPGGNDTGLSEAGDDAGSDDAGDDTGGGGEDTGPIGPSSCELRPACDAPLPPLGSKTSWRHTTTSLSVAAGSPRHRGRDLFLKPGTKQWAIAKFAYGAIDKDIKDEDVDVYLLRDCGSTWKKLGTYRTTEESAHTTEEGVIDSGGRVYVDIAAVEPIPLGVGRHRVHFVVKGDLPGANPGSPQVMTTLAQRGYYVFYLTARPEWFVQKTRDWVKMRGFPPGIIHTTFSAIGETGAAAIEYKTSELANLKTKTGIVPTYGFGNTDSDSTAYDNVKITPAANRYFFKYTDTRGGTSHDDYSKLVPKFAAEAAVCPATK